MSSLLWGAALHKAFPSQENRYRPSGIAKCARQQAALVNGIEPSDASYEWIWQAELGRAGQEIALKAFPFLGFEVKQTVPVDGPLPGEMDAIIEVLPTNIFGIEPGPALCDVKLRNTFAYNHVLQGYDLLSEDKEMATQMNTYMGQAGLNRCLILLFPFDTSACRNDQRFMKKEMVRHNYRIRVLAIDFLPSLYTLTLDRHNILKEHGLAVAPEFNPNDGKFPCVYTDGGCPVRTWCQLSGPGGIEVPAIPDYGMRIIEYEVA